MNSYSQYGQDVLVHKLLGYPVQGFFVEVGACDGVGLSNTLAFEELGWEGMCIEPNPLMFEQLVKSRNCDMHNVAAGRTSGVMPFTIVNRAVMLSGFNQFFTPQHQHRIMRESGSDYTVVDVRVCPLSDMVSGVVDYMSIDTEGSELEVLHGIRFDNTEVKVFSIENNTKDDRFVRFFADKPYVRHTIVGCDEIWINKSIT